MTERIRRANHGKENPYFLLSREAAQNRTLSFEARGMLAYLLSRPVDWSAQVTDLQQQCGRDKVYRVLRELINHGYITDRVRSKTAGGRWQYTDYIVHEVPTTPARCPKEPYTEMPHTEEPYTEMPDILHKREEQSTKKQNKETTKEKNSASDDALNDSESTGVSERDVNEMIAGWWEWTNKPTRRGSVVPAKAHFANKENRAYARALLSRGVTTADMIRTLADIRLNPKSRWKHLAERELTFCYVAPICEEWTQHERLHGFVYSEQFPRVTARRPDVVVRTGVYDDPDTIVDVPPVYVRAQVAASAEDEDADVSGMTADQLLAWIGEEV